MDWTSGKNTDEIADFKACERLAKAPSLLDLEFKSALLSCSKMQRGLVSFREISCPHYQHAASYVHTCRFIGHCELIRLNENLCKLLEADAYLAKNKDSHKILLEGMHCSLIEQSSILAGVQVAVGFE